jgi:superoxide oxidase
VGGGGWRNSAARYGSLSVALHWLMLVLIVAVFACIELREIYPKGSDPREALKSWHFMLGLLVFVLIWLRIAVHLAGPTPRIEPPPVTWQQWSAKLMHFALYVLMVGMPITGWLILSGEGKPVPFFGLHLPALISEKRDLAKSIEEIHETAGTVMYWLIGLHAAAALFHHYLVKDNPLTRMLPPR